MTPAFPTRLSSVLCEFFALEGLSQLLQTVERIRGRFNGDLSIMGVALTMYDRRNRLTEQVADDVRACLGNVVFNTVIPRNVRLSEARSEEHTSELQSLMRISYAVFCLKKKK